MTTLRPGHDINGYFWEFPHTCPGHGCAIERWLARVHRQWIYRKSLHKVIEP